MKHIASLLAVAAATPSIKAGERPGVEARAEVLLAAGAVKELVWRVLPAVIGSSPGANTASLSNSSNISIINNGTKEEEKEEDEEEEEVKEIGDKDDKAKEAPEEAEEVERQAVYCSFFTVYSLALSLRSGQRSASESHPSEEEADWDRDKDDEDEGARAREKDGECEGEVEPSSARPPAGARGSMD